MYPENYMKVFGERLREERKKMQVEGKKEGVTQTEFAEKLIDRQHKSKIAENKRIQVSNWENGKTPPTLDECIQICNILNVDLDYLLGRIDGRTYESDFIAKETHLTPENVDKLRRLTALDDRYIYCINIILSAQYSLAILNEIVSYMESKPFKGVTKIPIGLYAGENYEDIKLSAEELENAYLLTLIELLQYEKERMNKGK